MATIEIRDVLDNETGKTIFPRTHVDAVIGLKDYSFFEKVQDELDPTKYSVKLKSEYTGLWAEGWVASGGVGSQSGGGGGSSYMNDLLDVTAPNPATDDLLRWNGSAWVNVPQSQIAPAISFSDLTSHPNSLSGYGINDAYTKTQVDALLSNIDLDDYGASLSLGSVATYLKDANGKFVVDSSGRYIITAGTSTSINLVNGSGTVISSVIIPSASASDLLSSYVPTSRTINGHSLASDITLSAVSDLGVAQWAMGGEGDKIPFSILPDLYTIGTKVTDTAAKGTLLGIEAISNDLSSTGSENSLIKWENGAWHVFGNLYADGWIAAGGIGNGSGGGGTNSLYELVEVLPSTNPSTDHVFYYNGSKWTNTPLKTINGNNLIGSGNIQIEGGGGSGSTVAISNLLTSGKRVATITIDGTDYTIKDGLVWGTYNDTAKTVALTLNGQQYVLCVNGYSAGGGVSSESDPIFTASAAYGITSQNIASWNAKSDFSGSFNDLSNKPTTISGYGISDAKIANGVITLGNSTITPLTSHQPIYALTLSAGTFTAGTYTPNSASKSFNIPTTLDHITDGTNRKLSDYVTLSGTQTITGAKTFTTNPVTIGSTSSLSVNQSSHIDIGPIRIKFENNAVHITKADPNDTNNYGIYADGFVAAGGVQS